MKFVCIKDNLKNFSYKESYELSHIYVDSNENTKFIYDDNSVICWFSDCHFRKTFVLEAEFKELTIARRFKL